MVFQERIFAYNIFTTFVYGVSVNTYMPVNNPPPLISTRRQPLNLHLIVSIYRK